jgi:hypothetical protein
MGKRGPNAFKRNDAIRAIESARDAGIEPSMVEVVVTNDGSVIYRVYGEAPTPASAEQGASKEWTAEIAKLTKATPPKTKER